MTSPPEARPPACQPAKMRLEIDHSHWQHIKYVGRSVYLSLYKGEKRIINLM